MNGDGYGDDGNDGDDGDDGDDDDHHYHFGDDWWSFYATLASKLLHESSLETTGKVSLSFSSLNLPVFQFRICLTNLKLGYFLTALRQNLPKYIAADLNFYLLTCHSQPAQLRAAFDDTQSWTEHNFWPES